MSLVPIERGGQARCDGGGNPQSPTGDWPKMAEKWEPSSAIVTIVEVRARLKWKVSAEVKLVPKIAPKVAVVQSSCQKGSVGHYCGSVGGGDRYGVDSWPQGGRSSVGPVAVIQSGRDARGRKSSKNVVKIS